MPQKLNEGEFEQGGGEHQQAIERVQQVRGDHGRDSKEFIDAAKHLGDIESKIHWSYSEGVYPRDGENPKLDFHHVSDIFSSIEPFKRWSLTWSEFKERMQSQGCSDKKEPGLFLGGKFNFDGAKHSAGLQKSKAGEAPRAKNCLVSRCGENVQWVDALILDFDQDVSVAAFEEKYERYEFLLTSSFNHDPKNGKNRFRVAMPLKERVGALEVKKRKAALLEEFEGVDPVSFSLSHVFYFPSHPHGMTAVRIENQGEWFDLMSLAPSVARVDRETGAGRVTRLKGRTERRGEDESRRASITNVTATAVAEIVRALMACMPPDTESFRALKWTHGHTRSPLIVPFLCSLGYWARENEMDVGELCDLVLEYWDTSPYAEGFWSLISYSRYGDIGDCMGFAKRVRQGILAGTDLGLSQKDFDRSFEELKGLLREHTEIDHGVELLTHEEASKQLGGKLLSTVAGFHREGGTFTARNLVVRFEAGAGKTETMGLVLTAILKMFDDQSDSDHKWKVDYLVPDLKLTDEVCERFSERAGQNVHIQMIKGRQQLCKDQKVMIALEVGHSLKDPCEGCSYFDECSYPAQYKIPEGKHLIRVVNQRMIANRVSKLDTVEGPDFYIVDEDLVGSLYHERKFDDRYEFIKALPEGITQDSDAQSIRDGVLDGVRLEIIRLKKKPPGQGGRVEFKKFRSGANGSDVFKQQVSEQKQAKEGRGVLSDCKDLLEALGEAGQRVFCVERGGRRVLVLSDFRPLAKRYQETPCIYLDATAERMVVEHVLQGRHEQQRGVEYFECAVRYSKEVTVHQEASRSWSMTSLCPKVDGSRVVDEGLLRYAWDEVVRRSLNQGRKFAIITYKAVADYIREGRVPRGCKAILGHDSFGGVGHFGKIRGQDEFNKEGVVDLYIIGRYMESSQRVKRMAQTLFCPDDLSFEPERLPVAVTPGLYLDKKQYVDERVRAVFDSMNTAETVQAAHRLRLIFGDEEKHLYLLTNEVLPLRVDREMEIEGLARISKQSELEVEVRQALLDGEVGIKSGSRWKVWPKCLDEVEPRLRKGVLDGLLKDAEVVDFIVYSFKSKRENRMPRAGLVMGASEEVCRAGVMKEYSDDLGFILHREDTFKL